MKVSVIIPTYKRPDFLKETIESIWKQTVLPDEIIIGDDSDDNLTDDLVNNILIPISPIPIQYFHHKPSLREARNVDFQYKNASYELVLHLHDDDPIYPRCIEFLKAPFLKHPEIIASFGLQRMINEDGSYVVNPEHVNSVYFRTPERVGIVDGFMAGAVSMIPNNGFIVKREAVLSIGYNDNGRAGKAVDFYFGFRLGKLGKPFFFVNEYTSLCRIVLGSESRGAFSDNAFRSVIILLEDCKSEDFTPELVQQIRNTMPIAITTAIKLKNRKLAIKWLFSKYYRDKIFTLRGFKRILLIINPF
jgi:glycosyltransferase involved in cell wall biosynthesis